MLTLFFKVLILIVLVDLIIITLGHFWKRIKKTFLDDGKAKED